SICSYASFFFTISLPPIYALFPYTTLFRSNGLLEDVYGEEFLVLPHHQRAALIKALLVHTAIWPADSTSPIKQVLGPPENRQSGDRKSTRLNSSHVKISYAVFCLKKKKNRK